MSAQEGSSTREGSRGRSARLGNSGAATPTRHTPAHKQQTRSERRQRARWTRRWDGIVRPKQSSAANPTTARLCSAATSSNRSTTNTQNQDNHREHTTDESSRSCVSGRRRAAEIGRKRRNLDARNLEKRSSILRATPTGKTRAGNGNSELQGWRALPVHSHPLTWLISESYSADLVPPRIVTISSEAVGWMATQASKAALFKPARTATPKP